MFNKKKNKVESDSEIVNQKDDNSEGEIIENRNITDLPEFQEIGRYVRISENNLKYDLLKNPIVQLNKK